MAASVTTARRVRGATARTRPAAAGRRTRRATSIRSMRGNKRTHPFTWHAAAVGESFADIKFPGMLKNCEGCHLRGAYDFSNPASQSALPNRLYRTVATGFFAVNVGDTVPTYSGASCTAGTSAPQTDVGAYSLSPYITGVPANYGTGFSYNTGLLPANSCTTDGTPVTNPPDGTLQADPRTLVNSPIATACFRATTPIWPARTWRSTVVRFTRRAALRSPRWRPAWSAMTRVASRISRPCTRSSASCSRENRCGLRAPVSPWAAV